MNAPVDVLAVTFRSIGKSRREWVAHFDLGDALENSLAAAKVAWKTRAEILSVAALARLGDVA